jgi:dihydrofolate reductase
MPVKLPEINIIIAMTDTGLIGKGAGLPWKSGIDLRHFAKTTTGWPVVFGKNTAEGLIKDNNFPLKNRPCIILSRNFAAYGHANYFMFDGLETAISRFSNFEKIFIAGGAGLYKYALEQRGLVDNIYKTIFKTETPPEGDVYLDKDTLETMSEPNFKSRERRVFILGKHGSYVNTNHPEGKHESHAPRAGDTLFPKIVFETLTRRR